ncbi:hypothetical protein B4U80_04521, partial [Leptotrombidium deliense]
CCGFDVDVRCSCDPEKLAKTLSVLWSTYEWYLEDRQRYVTLNEFTKFAVDIYSRHKCASMSRQVHEIVPNLYLSGITGQESACIPFDYTIDVSNYRLNERNIDRRKTLVIEVNDDENADLYPHFDKICDTIHTKLRQKKSVLVHCAAGISRSTTLIIAYLM